MPPPQVTIIGAGISGLALGRLLRNAGVTCALYERDSAKQAATRYNYGITLYRAAYVQLFGMLRINGKSHFPGDIAVDAAVGGVGCLDPSIPLEDGLRANRSRLERLMRETLDIKWDHKLTDVRSNGSGYDLEFENGQKVVARFLVGADGAHSLVRKMVSPRTDLKVLPYVVFNGKRRIDRTKFDSDFAPHMPTAAIIECQQSDVLLRISLDDNTSERISISYTYSRPAREADPIFQPNRPNAGAKDIPAGFFEEVATFGDLKPPFDTVFNVDALKQDRMLNWLMRSVPVNKQDYTKGVGNGIVLLGDAAHHTPILGSKGANEAIVDAVYLSRAFISLGKEGVLDSSDQSADIKTLMALLNDRSADGWVEMTKNGEARLAEMHQQSRANL